MVLHWGMKSPNDQFRFFCNQEETVIPSQDASGKWLIGMLLHVHAQTNVHLMWKCRCSLSLYVHA